MDRRRNQNIDWGGSYPPGAKNDPRAPYNQPDYSHEHEWYLDDTSPILEDGAAIFIEECTWAVTEAHDMGRHGIEEVKVGPECDERRTYRMELQEITRIIEDGPNITIIEGNFDRFIEVLEDAMFTIEKAAREGEASFIDVDPDREMGSVEVEADGYRAVYEA